ncbi:5'-3' exoribonuclease 2 [Thoreauomyces humboldtii]|nr:5'-3' exoribonuclease 2 [Thoreauomyces humboldtii]
MGVPAFFRWLSQKYPKIVSPVLEERPREINGHSIPVDASQPNPNGEEFDNLYLDMNGIIHPCCHPEDKPAPTTEDEMFVEIFKYIDRIMGMIRPRKVLYMAIDGVAPRAKMNQQRSRRFRAAQEAQIEMEEEEKIRREWEAAGDVMPTKDKKAHFDSNCITPGTPFMSNLAVALRYYVADRLNTDPAWRNLKVVLSDATVPGEGEHKIMDYIRKQRHQQGYDPITRHVLYGLDADLIMLALATHEPYFKILREDVFAKDNANKGCFICGQSGHMANQCTGKKKEKNGEFDEKSGPPLSEKPFILLHVNVLREYLEIELKVLDLAFGWSTERAIDDWVFLCFFVGNDFLPHLPSLEIREGAIDKLIELWKKNLTVWGSYLTDSGDIDLRRVHLMMDDLGKVEDEIFRERRAGEDRRKQSRLRRARDDKAIAELKAGREPQYGDVETQIQDFMNHMPSARPIKTPVIASPTSNKAAAEALKLSLKSGLTSPQGVKRKEPEPSDPVDNEEAGKFPISVADVEVISDGEDDEAAIKDDPVEEDLEETMTVADVPIPHKPTKKAAAEEEEEPFDDVRLWESGWKQRYYENKFRVEVTDVAFRRSVVTSYVEGLCWVLKYYYQGCQSWHWFFPYNYAPFASDFDFVGELTIEFTAGAPFRPVEQLMGVLPAFSQQHIPAAFRPLMTDPQSPIIDFYPEKFPIDLNGKKYAWQGVALLPFIEEQRLRDAMDTRYHLLTDEEVLRNTPGDEILVVGAGNPLFESFCALYGRQAELAPIPIDGALSRKFFGAVLPDPEACLPGSTFESPLTEFGLADISNNQSISVKYYMPTFPEGHVYKSDLLRGVELPKALLDEGDAYAVRMGYNGSRGGRGRGRGRGRGGPSDRFIRNGIGARREGGNGGDFGRQYENRNQGYDNRMGGSDYDNKRPRYDSRPQSTQSGPYMGGGGYNSYTSGGGSSQSYGGGYVPNSNYGSAPPKVQSSYLQQNTYGGGSGYGGGAGGNQQGGQYQQTSYQQGGGGGGYGGGGQAYSQASYNSQQHGGDGYQAQALPPRPAGNLGWNRNVAAASVPPPARGGSNPRGARAGRGSSSSRPY